MRKTTTWLFHQYLDGMNTAEDLPEIAVSIDFDSVGGQISVDYTTRHKVNLKVECRSSEAGEMMNKKLKQGSIKIMDKCFKTFVYVTDKALFEECIKWKYDDTIKKWNTVDRVTPSP